MLELNKLNISKLNKKLSEAVPQEINIYNQAYLIAHTPLIETQVFHTKTSNEIALSFEVSGDLNGYILCYLDLDPDERTNGNFHFFQSLYIESMNIVLGKFLTNLERDSDLLAAINFPDIKSQKLEKIESEQKQFNKYSWSYKLVSRLKEYDCRINLFLK